MDRNTFCVLILSILGWVIASEMLTLFNCLPIVDQSCIRVMCSKELLWIVFSLPGKISRPLAIFAQAWSELNSALYHSLLFLSLFFPPQIMSPKNWILVLVRHSPNLPTRNLFNRSSYIYWVLAKFYITLAIFLFTAGKLDCPDISFFNMLCKLILCQHSRKVPEEVK